MFQLPTRAGNKRHNFIVIGLEFIFFGIAVALVSPTTILPSFADQLGAPAIFIGFLTTLIHVSWSFPQLFAGPLVARLPRKKPMLMTMVYIGRPTILLLGLLVWLTGASPTWLILLGIVLTVLIMFGTDSFAGVAWLEMISRMFDSRERPGFMAIWQAVASILILGMGGLVAFILSDKGPAFPNNYALMISLSGAAFMISALFLALMKEPLPEPGSEGDAAESITLRGLLPNLLRIWRSDSAFRLATLSRLFFSLSMVTFPFYVLYATDVLALPPRVIGLFIGAQTTGTLLGALTLGRIADQRGAEHAIRLALGVILTAPLLALGIAAGLGLLRSVYLWIYLCIGVADNLVVIGYFNYILNTAPERERPVYIGASNAIANLGTFSPILGGWLLVRTSYEFLFVLSLALLAIAFWLALRLRPSLSAQELEVREPQAMLNKEL